MDELEIVISQVSFCVECGFEGKLVVEVWGGRKDIVGNGNIGKAWDMGNKNKFEAIRGVYNTSL